MLLTSLVWFEKKTWVFEAPTIEYICAIFKIKAPSKTFVLWQFYTSFFYTACSRIHFECLDGNLNFIWKWAPPTVLISRTPLLIFNGCFQIVNRFIKDTQKICFGKSKWLSHKLIYYSLHSTYSWETICVILLTVPFSQCCFKSLKSQAL